MSQSNRLIVYRQFPSPDEHNVLSFQALPFSNSPTNLGRNDLTHKSREHPAPRRTTSRKSTAGLPEVLSICQEARDYALKRFFNIFPGSVRQPEAIPDERPLLEKPGDLERGRAARASEPPTLLRYAVTAQPTRASAADHGESPSIEDGLGFQHCWKEEEALMMLLGESAVPRTGW